jgi:hypothetical protein
LSVSALACAGGEGEGCHDNSYDLSHNSTLAPSVGKCKFRE